MTESTFYLETLQQTRLAEIDAQFHRSQIVGIQEGDGRLMGWLFRLFVWGFVILYAAALLAYGAGTFGWAGFEKDPLSGIFLILLGQPWVILFELLPEFVRPVVAVLAPLANLAILVGIFRLADRRSR